MTTSGALFCFNLCFPNRQASSLGTVQLGTKSRSSSAQEQAFGRRVALPQGSSSSELSLPSLLSCACDGCVSRCCRWGPDRYAAIPRAHCPEPCFPAQCSQATALTLHYPCMCVGVCAPFVVLLALQADVVGSSQRSCKTRARLRCMVASDTRVRGGRTASSISSAKLSNGRRL